MIGRFIQEDSYLGDGLNLFAYCQNNPLVYFDPTGHAADRSNWCKNKIGAIEFLENHGVSEEDALKRYDELRNQNFTPLKAKEIIMGVRTPDGKKIRMPQNNGHWTGDPGNSLWISDIPEVNEITGGEGIPFTNGRPDFSKWSKGSLEFEKGELNGTDGDFNVIYKKLAEKYEFDSAKEAQEFLSDMKWTPHHYSETEILLIPTKLHGNIPHVGSASDMRNSGGY